MKKILITILILCLFVSFGFAQGHKDGAHKGGGLAALMQGAVQGDIIYWDGTAWVKLNIGSNGEFLTTNGSIPNWGAGGGAASDSSWTSARIDTLTSGDDTDNVDGTIKVISAAGADAIVMTGDATPMITFTNSSAETATIDMNAAALTIKSSSEDVHLQSDQAGGAIRLRTAEDKTGSALVYVEFAAASDEFTSSSLEQAGLRINTRYFQTSTAGAVDFLVDRLENTVGSGADLLMDLRLIGVPQFSVSPTGEVTANGAMNFAADAQGDDDYEIAIPNISALVAGLTVTFTANTANTDGATLEITSVGDIDALVIADGASVATALVTGQILAGQVITAVFDGANWQITSRLATDKN